MRLVAYILAIVISTVNLLTFILYGIDKLKSKHNGWRISERCLLWFTFCGGSVGAMFGMLIFHHKTNHLKFRILVPLFFVLHIATVIVAYWYLFINIR